MNIWIENAQLGSALLKGSCLLLVTALAVSLMRKASAASQFRVCFVGLCMSLLVAVASVVASMANLEYSILHSQAVPDTDSVTLIFSERFAVDYQHEFSHTRQSSLARGTINFPRDSGESTDRLLGSPQSYSSPTSLQNESILDANTGLAAQQPTALTGITEGEVEPASGQSWIQPFSRYWPYLWVIGAAAVLLRLLVPYWLSTNASQRLEKLKDSALVDLNDKLARQLHLPAPALWFCSESITPFAIGLWRPRIILPPDARTWSDQRLTFVLLHEMAHIKRRDLLTQFLAGSIVAVNWFNPLSWWLFAQMMRLRELACDDCVLLQEQQPISYAETLLEVAGRYRSMGHAHGIAMAGKLDIARRIHCALDSTRARKPFGKRTLLSAVAAALVLCLAIGAIQLRTRAAEPQDETEAKASELKETPENKNTESSADSKSQESVNEEARSMLIRVVDEQSKPLERVDVYVTGIDYERRGNLPRIHYPTDATGTTIIKFREGKLSLQLWPRLSGYVPQYVKLDEKKLSLPTEYTFHFEKGERLGGRVVDDTGKPIANASVQVRTEGEVALNELAQQSSPPAQCDPWLASDNLAAITNAKGEWEILNAPSIARNPRLQFELLVNHPDFAGDRSWGSYQAKQGITSEQLRNGTATLVMDRGVALRGTVTGPDGAPVTKGLVIWVTNPYIATGVNEVPIQPDGTFQTPNLAPANYPITVLAPGFAPDQREITLSHGTLQCDFQLEPGNPIRIEIVDSAGKAIPNAAVSFEQGGWRGTSAIYNNDHSAVPDSGIPRRADVRGVYAWDWAPSDAVTYRLDKSGYDSKTATLVPRPEAHRVILTAPMTISGNVVDAETGNPINDFKVIRVKAFRPDFYSTNFQESSVAIGEKGKYEIQINSYGESTDRFRVRIEADGYRSALGRLSLAAGDPPLVEDFRLEPAAPLVGRVVSPDRSPATKFKVAIGTATFASQFDFERPDTFFGKAFKVEGNSSFKVAASFEPQRIRIFNDEGFAELVVQPEQKEIGEVLLQPYANVSGRLMQGDVPVGNEEIYFYPLVQRGLTEARFQDSFYTRTNPEGYFDFGRLPPVAGVVRAHLGPWRDSSLTSSQSIPLELQPGEHKQIVLSGKGISISGRVVAKGRSNDQFSKQWSLNWLVSRKAGVRMPPDATPLSIPSNPGPIESAWLKHTDFPAWLTTKENHYVKLRDDGYFRIHGVKPGEYDLVMQLYDQPAGCLIEAVGTSVVPVVLTAEHVNTGELKLGTIDVECRSGPRPGSDMRAYQFVNAAGQVVSVDDFGGQHILLHVWASWCAPCLASMPQIKADISQLQKTQFTAVGINVDADKSQGQAIATKLELDWAQNFVGDNSDLARQLAISSVPAYYLIGQDGKLVASSSDWKEIRQALEDKLKP
jgi:beta-lactamase regulating signal transducer with metallopeptidase domain/thiol-disulfide isomerase/thioredoxin